MNNEPTPQHGQWHGAKNDWHYKPNEKEKLLLPHELEGWKWPVIGILLGVVGFWAGVVWLIDWWWTR